MCVCGGGRLRFRICVQDFSVAEESWRRVKVLTNIPGLIWFGSHDVFILLID